MVGLRATTSGLTSIHLSSFPCTGVRRTVRFYTLQEVSPLVINKDHTTLEEFENGCFTLKTHQMSSVHTTGGI